MKLLKILLNALISGFLFSCLIALLVMDLNLDLPIHWLFFLQLSVYLSIIYGMVVALICIIFFFIIQFFAGRSIKLAFVSPSFLIVSFTSIIIVFLLIFRGNIRHFFTLFTPDIQTLVQNQLMTLASIALLGLLLFIASLIYKRRFIFFLAFFLLFVAGLTYTGWQRLQFPEPQQSEKVAVLEARPIEKKITIIGMEGLSFNFIIPFISEDKLPNFSFLIDNGSWGELENFTPNESLILNNSFNSGKLPSQHRQASNQEYSLLNLGHKIRVIPRYVLFKQLTRTGILSSKDSYQPRSVQDIWDIFRAIQVSYLKMDGPFPTPESAITPEAETIFNRFYEELQFETDEIFTKLKASFCADVAIEAQITRQKDSLQPQLVYFLLPGLNEAQSYFYKFSFPDLFGEVDQEEIHKYNTVIEQYYQFYDEIIGKYLAAKKDDELLVVYSPHGIEALPLWKRISEWFFGDPQISAYHENAPEGVFFMIGKDIARGRNIQGMRILDVAPSMLHYLGLPVGKDMDGVVNSSIFEDEFKREPVLYISSYEEHDINIQ